MIDFDAKAETWDANPVMVKRARAVADGIKAGVVLDRHMNAFEYGCGTGLLGFALQPYVGHITLADSSAGMLAVLERKIATRGVHNMNAIKLDLATDALPSGRYHLICTLMTLHHVVDTEKILEDFYGLLERSWVPVRRRSRQ